MIFSTACDKLVEDGFVPFTTLATHDDIYKFVPVVLAKQDGTLISPNDKETWKAALCELSKQMKYIVQMSETWIAVPSENYNPSLPISQQAERKEGLMVYLQSQDATWMILQEFSRDEDGKPNRPLSREATCVTRNTETGRSFNYFDA